MRSLVRCAVLAGLLALPLLAACSAPFGLGQFDRGRAVLGGDLAAFQSNLGKPIDSSAASNGVEKFRDTHGNTITVQSDVSDGGQYAQHVMLVAVVPPAGHTWSESAAHSLCQAFAPSDASAGATVTGPRDRNITYRSASLAGRFPATAYSDRNGQRIAAGTFTIGYGYTSPAFTAVDACTLVLGAQVAA